MQRLLSVRPGGWTPFVNPLTPNGHYRCRTALLTCKRCILYIYSTNIGTEYFKHGIYSPLTPKDHYRGRTAPLTCKRCILYIYTTNIGTEYFKHGIDSTFFFFKVQFVS